MVFNSFDKNIFSRLLNLRYKYNFGILSLSATVPISENKVGINKEIFLIGLPIVIVYCYINTCSRNKFL